MPNESLTWTHEKERLLGSIGHLKPVTSKDDELLSFGYGFKDGLEKSYRLLTRPKFMFPDLETQMANDIMKIREFFSKNKNRKDEKTMTTKEALLQKTEELRSLQMKADSMQQEINDLQKITETECSVTMRPVCDCGHIFTSLEIEARLGDSGKGSDNVDITIPRFSPTYCPKCNKRIMSIQNPITRNGRYCDLGDKITYAKE